MSLAPALVLGADPVGALLMTLILSERHVDVADSIAVLRLRSRLAFVHRGLMLTIDFAWTRRQLCTGKMFGTCISEKIDA